MASPLLAVLGGDYGHEGLIVLPFLVPCRTFSTEGSTWNSKGFYLELKRVLHGTKKGSSKGSSMGTAEEPF